MMIVRKECPGEFDEYMSCLEQNPTAPENCNKLKESMFECGKGGYKKANTDPDYTY
jgi:hypothetical protein